MPQFRVEAAKPALKPLTYGERLELDKILGVIAGAEDELSTLEKRLADPTLYASGGGAAEARELEAERERVATRVTELTRRWEDLEARKDAAR
jgi:ATP-binding cassette subfamily F protein uup